MDPLSQGVVGAACAQAPGRPVRLRDAAVLGGLAGMAPDLDVLIRSSSDPLLFLEFHRHFTHSLVFIPVGALICAGLLHGFFRHRLAFRQTYLFCFLGYASHGLLDACTTYGTQLLWPFSDARIAWHNVSVVDPLFTLPLLGLIVAGWVKQRPGFARLALVWGVSYLLLGVVQNHRAVSAGWELARARGHEPTRLEAKPGFGNLLLWKIVYAHDGRYYVDGVRVGLVNRVFPGVSVTKLDVARQLPWLAAGSQQAKDIERFRWFSNDYLALAPNRQDLVVDIRYSVLPNELAPLWGIGLDPAAGQEAHASFVTNRTTSAAQRERLLSMLFAEPAESGTVTD